MLMCPNELWTWRLAQVNPVHNSSQVAGSLSHIGWMIGTLEAHPKQHLSSQLKQRAGLPIAKLLTHDPR